MKTSSFAHPMSCRETGSCPGGLSRREFIQRSAASAAAVGLASTSLTAAEESSNPLPTRILGRTKAKVTILGLGTAPVGEAMMDRKEAEKIFGEAMDRGVNYIDTARSYGHAEEVLSNLVPARRDKLFLVTKAWTDNGANAEKLLNESLQRLKTDYVDLMHIHNLGNKNLEKVLAKDGILEFMIKQKKAGKIRFIGMSGHERPGKYLEMLKTGEIDVMMTVMNYADRNIYDFEGKVLPECRKNNVGVVAMKVYAGIKGGFPNHRKGGVGCNTPPEKMSQALAYALDLEGVSSAIIGPFTLEQAIQNIELARKYKPLSQEERKSLLEFGKELAEKLGPRYGPVG